MVSCTATPYFFLRFFFVCFTFCFSSFFAQHGDLTSIINEKGCLLAGEEWLEKNLLVVAGVAVGIAFLQVSFFPMILSLLFFNAKLQCILQILSMIDFDCFSVLALHYGVKRKETHFDLCLNFTLGQKVANKKSRGKHFK